MIDRQPQRQPQRYPRALAALGAFLLPLGVVGIAGIVVLALHALAFCRRALPGEGRLLLAALPLALLPIAATLAFALEAGRAPEGAAIGHVLGMAALLLIAPVAARRVVAQAGAALLLWAFVLGAVGLAVSVFVDVALGWHHIPAGLYREGTLHNVTATVLVVGFAPALQLASAGRARWAGALAALTIAAGVVAALSWVGALGLMAALLAFAALRWGVLGTIGGALTALAAAWLAWWSLAEGLWRGPAAATLGEVLGARLRIIAQGLELAGERPWLGWGWHLYDLRGPLGGAGLGIYHVDDLVLPHFHNLYVQTLFETGVLGLMALALWFGSLLLTQRGPWRAAASAALVGFLVTQLGDYLWQHATVVVSVTLVAMVGLAPERAVLDGKAASRSARAIDATPSVRGGRV